jgi:hypothetical protein
MAGGGGGSSTQTGIDPSLKPYVEFGLSEGQKLYQGAGPQYYQGQTYVSPSAATQTALQAAQTRAVLGSPIQQSAQQEYLSTIQGKGVNPFLEGALAGANRQATEAYTRGVQGLQSKASSMGRYGSNAMGQQVGQAQDVFGRNLAETAGNLAYQSAEAERGRQMAAVANAPAYAQSDYQDIQRLLTAGQAGEQYAQNALQADINRYNYEQQLPQMKLQNFANLFTSAPGGNVSTTTQSGGK